MNTAVRLIVLNSTKLGDSSLVLHCLCREMGRRSFIVAVRKGGSRAMYLPFSILDAEVMENRKSDLWRLRGVSAAHALNGVRSDLNKNAITLFMSEVLWRGVQEGAAEEGLFDWCERSILTLDALDADFANFHLRFLVELSGALGFSPTLEDIAPFAGEHLGVVRELLGTSFSAAMLIPLTGAQRNALCELLLQYLEYHTESPIRVKSLAVLRELYQ